MRLTERCCVSRGIFSGDSTLGVEDTTSTLFAVVVALVALLGTFVSSRSRAVVLVEIGWTKRGFLWVDVHAVLRVQSFVLGHKVYGSSSFGSALLVAHYLTRTFDSGSIG